jgi:hypothetical protein
MRMLLFFVVIVACAAYLLTREKPGTGPGARNGMAASRPIVEAIEAYRASRGNYPTSLDDLVPEFLPALPKNINGHGFDYTRKGLTDFSFTFGYTTPLPVHCSQGSSHKWNCGYLNF